MNDTITEIVRATPFVDTHEHLVEESRRLAGVGGRRVDPGGRLDLPSFNQYLSDDLDSAGMPAADATRFFGPDLGAEAKYRLVAPYWERVKHTGYAQAVRETLRGLYGEDDLTAASAPRIAEKYRALVQAGLLSHDHPRAGQYRGMPCQFARAHLHGDASSRTSSPRI